MSSKTAQLSSKLNEKAMSQRLSVVMSLAYYMMLTVNSNLPWRSPLNICVFSPNESYFLVILPALLKRSKKKPLHFVINQPNSPKSIHILMGPFGFYSSVYFNTHRKSREHFLHVTCIFYLSLSTKPAGTSKRTFPLLLTHS